MLPATGTLTAWEPASGPGIRVDAGVRRGSEISVYYDSLLAKLIVHAAERALAVERLEYALGASRICGVRTNLPLLERIVRDEDFRRGTFSTGYLDGRFETEAFVEQPPPSEVLLLAAAAIVDRALAGGGAWRLGGIGIPIALRYGEREYRCTASRGTGPGEWELDGDVSGVYTLSAQSGFAPTEGGVTVTLAGLRYEFSLAAPPSAMGVTATRAGANSGRIEAPMPGKVLKVAAFAGDTVGARDLLVVLEAMKMEHRIEAPQNGMIRAVHVAPGQFVTAGVTLVELA
jgi:acetyl/propionyl-CoA carboxylase alpha subunit